MSSRRHLHCACLLLLGASAALARAEAPVAAGDIWCGASDEAFLGRLPAGDDPNRGFARITPEHLDTEHFRIHYSMDEGRVGLPGINHDCAVVGDRLLVASRGAGLTLVDISHPPSPLLLATLDIGDDPSAVVTEGDLVAIAGSAGLTIARLAGDALVARATLVVPGPGRTVEVDGATLAYAHALGVELIDVSTPSAPVVHKGLDIEAVSGLHVAGNRLYAVTEDSLFVVDVTSIDMPEILSALPVGGFDVTARGSFAVVATGVDGVAAIDVSNPSAPIAGETWTHDEPVRRVTWRDDVLFVSGETYLYAATLDDTGAWRMSSQTPMRSSVHEVLFHGEHALIMTGVDVRVVDLGRSSGLPRPIDDALRPGTTLDRLAAALENAWAHFMELGFRLPRPDGARGGGQDLIDCYITELSGRAGFATIDFGNPIDGCAYTGYFGLDRDAITPTAAYSEDMAAHEVFHAIQYAYGRAHTWTAESSADWAARQVWTDGNGGRFHGCWGDWPFLPLWSQFDRCNAYGLSHLWTLLEERAGSGFHRTFWELNCEMHPAGTIETLVAATEAHGTTLTDELYAFALWSLATGPRHDGRHFASSGYLPPSTQAEHGAYPISAESDPSRYARAGAANYMRLTGPAGGSTLNVRFDGTAEVAPHRAVTLVATRRTNRHVEIPIPLDVDGDGEIALEAWPTYDEAILVVANSHEADGDLSYAYEAWETGAPPEPAVYIAGTPATRGATIVLRIAGAPEHVRVDVYDAQGRLVRALADELMAPGNHYVRWDGSAATGAAGAGVYFAAIDVGGARKVERIVVVR